MDIIKVGVVDYAMSDGKCNIDYIGNIIYDISSDCYIYFEEKAWFNIPAGIVEIVKIIETQDRAIIDLKKDLHGYSQMKEDYDGLMKDLQKQKELNIELREKKNEILSTDRLLNLKKAYTADEIINLREAGLI